VLDLGQAAYYICLKIDDAIEISRKIVYFTAAENPSNPELGSLYLLNSRSDPIVQPKIIAFLDELMTSTNPAVRYLGLKWGGYNLHHPWC